MNIKELDELLHDEPNESKYDQEYNEIIKNYLYGDVYQHGTLDLKLRQLILIVVDTTNHTLNTLKEHVIGAVNAKCDPVSIKEAIYQCSPYVGIGKVQDALEVVNTVFEAKNIKLPLESQATVTKETRFEKGFDVQSAAFGRENIQANHDNAAPELKHIQNYLSEYCFGDFYTRKGLDLPTRELITFVMLASLGGCENQLRAHTQANLTVGNTREMLLETITQCQPYIGFPRTLNAINIINEITNK
ncbi:carboxymuconolactone decarboxylase family protein [uncultured Thomasclavelia sp.]|uniref:carboxymuconolactone decarboxylase family protein n=1 Tax=uncultured Thomasclavelia sp. TaxID=3025759 RepID=UPI0025FAB0E9|nr:carboxymuconolactone decarboxylase family protein [uncultured Thomasclavelia sp.]